MRWRRRLRSISRPPATSTTGSPSSSGRRRRKRKLSYAVPTVSTAIVTITIVEPVSE